MSDAAVPSTIGGVKRLAKRIKREHSIQHSKALDVAAVVAGFDNYQHALRTLLA